MKGNVGEALAQYVLSKFCLVHKIDGSSDVGNDLICELIRNQYPTNLLFYVQVKYCKRKPGITKRTKEYWKMSPIPVYLFWIKDEPPQRILTATYFRETKKYYKRYTPIMHGKIFENQVSFKDYDELEFKRDLIVDYSRTQYVRGFTPIVRPRDFLPLDEKIDLGLGRSLYIRDVIPEYSEEILNGSWTNLLSIAYSLRRESREDSKGDPRTVLILLHLARNLAPEGERSGGIYSFLEDQIQEVESELGDSTNLWQLLPKGPDNR